MEAPLEDDSHRVPGGEAEVELQKVKGSRFIGLVKPVSTEQEARAFVEATRARFHDSRHVAFAWRLGERGTLHRASDDGEPSGSAGKPLLAEVDGRELVDVVVCVARWFGGTKLGVGGLVRAYGAAAAEALDAAGVTVVVPTRRVVVRHAYDLTSAVQGLVAATGLEPVASDFGEQVTLSFDVPRRRVDGFLRELTDRTAGGAVVETADDPRDAGTP